MSGDPRRPPKAAAASTKLGQRDQANHGQIGVEPRCAALRKERGRAREDPKLTRTTSSSSTTTRTAATTLRRPSPSSTSLVPANPPSPQLASPSSSSSSPPPLSDAVPLPHFPRDIIVGQFAATLPSVLSVELLCLPPARFPSVTTPSLTTAPNHAAKLAVDPSHASTRKYCRQGRDKKYTSQEPDSSARASAATQPTHRGRGSAVSPGPRKTLAALHAFKENNEETSSIGAAGEPSRTPFEVHGRLAEQGR